MKCEKCGQEYDGALGACPRCTQRGQTPAPAYEAAKAVAPAPDQLQAPPASPRAAAPRKKKHGLLIGAGAVILAVIAALAGMFFSNRHQEREYQIQLELGYRYLDQGDYEEAILAFNAAIEIRPKKAEPYLGRGDVYTAMEDFDNASVSYERALRLDDSLVDAYLGLANAYLEMGDIDAAMDVLEEGLEITEDREIREWLEALENADGTASLQGTVSEYLPGGGSALLPDAFIRLYTTDTDEERLIRVAETDDSGVFVLEDMAGGTYTLHVDAPGHIGLETTEDLEEDAVTYTELYLLIPTVRGQKKNDFHAAVTNAINGEGVPEAEVRLRRGWNNTEGKLAISDVFISDYDGGIYAENLSVGYYTAEVWADGFTPSFHNVAVVPEEFYTEWNLPLSPRLADGETRIVLTWGEQPPDLDSHLYNSDFHVFFSDRDYYQNSEHLVNLDLDDTDSYGPETVTLYRELDKDCVYYVHDYSNGGNSSSTQLSASGATVRVYQSAGLVATFHVPTGGAGDRWTVFTLKADGTIIPENTIGMDHFW